MSLPTTVGRATAYDKNDINDKRYDRLERSDIFGRLCRFGRAKQFAYDLPSDLPQAGSTILGRALDNGPSAESGSAFADVPGGMPDIWM